MALAVALMSELYPYCEDQEVIFFHYGHRPACQLRKGIINIKEKSISTSTFYFVKVTYYPKCVSTGVYNIHL